MSTSISDTLSCDDVLRMLSSLLEGGLHAELRGRVDGHLSRCMECTAAFARLRAMAILAGTVPKPPEARIERVESVLYPVRKTTRSAAVGMMWQRGTSCRTLSAEEQQMMTRTRRRLRDAMEHSRRRLMEGRSSAVPRGALRTRGGGGSRPKLHVEVLNAQWEPIVGAAFDCELAEDPSISPDGVFRMTVVLGPDCFQRYRGSVMVCTLAADDERIAFETALSSTRIEFVCDQLPHLDTVMPVDRSWLQLCVVPSAGL